ncbi:hypothetical protein [Acinetobacter seifertii]|uniref:hypothetical protein n=1 Tax=Acinetobacter seifertii TaxID=1530123 RepID=UPI00168B9B6E|nr:hypothetical protein [Acinetobacter seifertii]QNX59305.1 hypothetical protein IC781_11120 [Acinetobacter seifertii]
MFLYASTHSYAYQTSMLVNNSSHTIQSIRAMFKPVTYRQRWFGFGLIFSSSS